MGALGVGVSLSGWALGHHLPPTPKSSLGAICNRRFKITQMNSRDSCFKGYERRRLSGRKQRCPENSQPSLTLGPKTSQVATSTQVLGPFSWSPDRLFCWPLSEMGIEQVEDGHVNTNTGFPSSTVTHFCCVPTALGSSAASPQCPVTHSEHTAWR